MAQQYWNTIEGINFSTAQKIARFVFPEHFHTANRDDENREFIIMLKPGADEEVMEYWKNYWPKSIRLIEIPSD